MYYDKKNEILMSAKYMADSKELVLVYKDCDGREREQRFSLNLLCNCYLPNEDELEDCANGYCQNSKFNDGSLLYRELIQKIEKEAYKEGIKAGVLRNGYYEI